MLNIFMPANFAACAFFSMVLSSGPSWIISPVTMFLKIYSLSDIWGNTKTWIFSVAGFICNALHMVFAFMVCATFSMKRGVYESFRIHLYSLHKLLHLLSKYEVLEILVPHLPSYTLYYTLGSIHIAGYPICFYQHYSWCCRDDHPWRYHNSYTYLV